MRKLVGLLLIAMTLGSILDSTLGSAPAMAATSLPKGGGARGVGVGGGDADDLIRRIERDLDRLTRNLELDLQRVERAGKASPAAPTNARPPARR